MTARRTTRSTRKKETAHPLMSASILELVAARFRNLGDPSRLRLLHLLMRGARSVQELVDESGLSQTNVSRHLGLLRRDGMVGRVRDGNRAVYRITDPHIEKLCEIVCGSLSDRLLGHLHGLQGGGSL